MNGNIGHWKLECEYLPDAKSFTYMMVGSNGIDYVGAKDMSTPWEYYQSSSKLVREAIQGGVTFEYCILKMFKSKHGAFKYEAELIKELQCDESASYYNQQSRGPSFNFCGRHHTEENIEKIRESSLGRKHSDESKQKMRAKRLNVHRLQKTEDTKDKMREAKMGTKIPEDVRSKITDTLLGRKSLKYRVQIGDVVYESLNAAAKAQGCTPQTISYRAKSGNFPNYKILS